MSPPIDIELLLRNQAWLQSLAMELVGDGGGAEDLLQQTWLRALESPPRAFELARTSGDERPLRAWLAQVLRNAARNWRRKEGNRGQREREAAHPEVQPSLTESLEIAAMHETLARAVMALDVPAREVVVLRYFENLGSKEIGQRLGISPGAVRMRLKRALNSLRSHFDREDGDSDHPWRASWAVLLSRPNQIGSATVPGAEAALSAAGKWTLAFVAAVLVAVGTLTALRGLSRDPALSQAGSEDSAEIVVGFSPAQAPEGVGASSERSPVNSEQASRGDLARIESAVLGYSIPGRVVDEGRRPLAGLDVRLILPGREALTTTTDVEGRYNFEGVPLDMGRLDGGILARDSLGRAGARHVWLPARRERSVKPWLSTFQFDIVLHEGAPVTVEVTDEGLPASGVGVQAFFGYERLLCAVEHTDEHGVAEFGALPAGALLVDALSGNRRARKIVGTRWNAPTQVALQLSAASSLDLIVRELGSGEPLQGVSVGVMEQVRPSGMWGPGSEYGPGSLRNLGLSTPDTDAHGRTRIQGLPQDAKLALRLFKPGYSTQGPLRESGGVPVDLPKIRAGKFVVELTPPRYRTVRWALRGAQRRTLSRGSGLTVERLPGEGAEYLSSCMPTAASIDGDDLVVSGVPDGSFRALVTDPLGRFAELRIEGGETRGNSIFFRAPRRISVTLRGPGGEPVVGANVELHTKGAGRLVGAGSTDSHGRAVVECRRRSALNVIASLLDAPGLSEPVGFVPADSWHGTVEGKMPATEVYRFRILIDGQPGLPTDVFFRIGGNQTDGFPLSEEDPDRGIVGIRCWKPVEGSLLRGHITGRGYLTAHVSVDVSHYDPGSPTDVELLRAASILARIEHAQDTRHRFGLLRLKPERMEWQDLERTEYFPAGGWGNSNTGDGAYRYDGLEPGSYRLIDHETGALSPIIDALAGIAPTETYWKIDG